MTVRGVTYGLDRKAKLRLVILALENKILFMNYELLVNSEITSPYI